MDKKWIAIIIILVLIWGSFAWYFVSYGREVRKDPCLVCSERMGKEVVCTTGTIKQSQMIFYPNGSIEQLR